MTATTTTPTPTLELPPQAPTPRAPSPRPRKRTLYDRVEAFISKLSTRNNFWHRVCSLVWLPYAFRSGITMKRTGADTFTAVLPFRRFNKNWYNAMAGASLLANSEIAGGMYLFAAVGEGYTVVCKELTYRFMRPCLGPAVYRVKPIADLPALMASGKEFNITVELEIFQGVHLPRLRARPKGQAPDSGADAPAPADREKRVGRCVATFHCTPKEHHKSKDARRAVPGLPAAGPDARPPGSGGVPPSDAHPPG
ncbi:MAG: hypothetical protein IBJ11_08640 [Phycisphaerales bacterium]|nr:hypothetical protein [Phycisphaerales bacterium]